MAAFGEAGRRWSEQVSWANVNSDRFQNLQNDGNQFWLRGAGQQQANLFAGIGKARLAADYREFYSFLLSKKTEVTITHNF